MKSYQLVATSIKKDWSDLVHIFFFWMSVIFQNEDFMERQIEKAAQKIKNSGKTEMHFSSELFL